MKHLIILSLTLLIFTTVKADSNPDYAVSLIPENLIENAHTVVRYEKTTFSVDDVNRANMHYKGVITILSPKSPYINTCIFYNEVFDKVNVKYIRIYDANGKLIKKIKSKNIIDQSQSDGISVMSYGRVKCAYTEQNDFPYTVEYEYTEVSKNTMFYPRWMILKNYKVAIEKSEFEVVTAKDIEVRYLIRNSDVQPKTSQEGKYVKHHFEAENLAAIVDEPMSPISEKVLPHVIFAPTLFRLEDYKGDMSSWENLGTFNYNLNKDRDVLSEDMQSKVKELIANARTKEDKIKILYNYLQNNMRYVSIQLGIGGWQTFDAKYVEQNKYGDCKALTNFMKSMLKVADIEAYAALIKNGNNVLDQELDFATSSFNHVILYVPKTEKGDIWLECTSSDLPMGTIGASNENRHALIIKPTGSQLLKTPTSDKSSNVLLSQISLKLDKLGQAKISVNQKATGRQEGIYRYYAINESEKERHKMLRKILELPSFKINDLTLSPSKEQHETLINFDIDVPKYASRGGKRMFVNPNAINQLSNVPRSMKNRKLPVENTYGFSNKDIVTFIIPDGYAIESMPKEAILIESEFGKYEASFEQKGKELIYTRIMERKTFSVSKDAYEDYRDFMKAVSKADKTKIVLVMNQP